MALGIHGTFAITGPEGEGKSLISVYIIYRYLLQGRKVATNMNLWLENLMPPHDKSTVIRVPDYPNQQNLLDIGHATFNPDESENGALVLDEVAVFMNSRDWNTDKDYRKGLMSFFRQSLKRGWDKFFLAQGYDSFDSQIRKDLIKFLGRCRRTDSMRIPFIGAILNTFGLKSMLPKSHIVTIKSGAEKNAMVADRFMTRGKQFWGSYERKQQYSPDPHYIKVDNQWRMTNTPIGYIKVTGQGNEFNQDMECLGIYSYLSAWHIKGRYLTFWQRNAFYINFLIVLILLLTFLFNLPSMLGAYFQTKQALTETIHADKPPSNYQSIVTGVIELSKGKYLLNTKNGTIYATSKRTHDEIDYYYDGQQYYTFTFNESDSSASGFMPF